MEDIHNESSQDALRGLCRVPPRVMVPILHTNIFSEVSPPPLFARDIFRPSNTTAGPGPSSAWLIHDAGPAPPGTASAVVPPVHARSPSPAPSALTDISINSLPSAESEEPTHPRGWDLNGQASIEPPPKAPTKATVQQLLKRLYGLRTEQEVEDKYIEFRNTIVAIARRRLNQDVTFTKQKDEDLQALYNELIVTYTWFGRCPDGWPARPYLMERQRNLTKRKDAKAAVAVGREAKKLFGRMPSAAPKQISSSSLRKTRSKSS
ncbi:hypothetical protein C8F01DRAFT_1249573 [Mycena amicta]|nr:hypothetical protein C8F01DRAFT_1083741 [Mycena amicta]KAJ7064540.1 hypothetical protein C8F01DRAFT_1249573 [Mycena amicta]